MKSTPLLPGALPTALCFAAGLRNDALDRCSRHLDEQRSFN